MQESNLWRNTHGNLFSRKSKTKFREDSEFVKARRNIDEIFLKRRENKELKEVWE